MGDGIEKTSAGTVHCDAWRLILPEMMSALSEQLVLELPEPEAPGFENFVPGPNAEVLSAVMRFAAGDAAETGLLLWGASGTGKTHLLKAAVAAVGEAGVMLRPPELVTADMLSLAGCRLVAIDDIDTADAEAEARVFTLYNALKLGGNRLLAASGLPLAALSLREDVRTRLGWGLVYQVIPLADADKPAALVDYARRRGFALAEDVIRYLLLHSRRDMSALCGTLAALDRHSLATKRPITVPLLRDWLQRKIALGG